MNPITWLIMAVSVASWPASHVSNRLRNLARSGRLAQSLPQPPGSRSLRMPGWPVAVLVGLVAGLVVAVNGGRSAGVSAGVAGAVAAGVVLAVLSSGLREREDRKRRDDLHLALSVLCGELEAGSPPSRAVASAGEAVPRYARELAGVLRGSPADPARFEESVGALEPVAVAWRIADRTGAPLADVLGRVRADIDAERALLREVAAAVAAPRSSAALLAALPLLGIGLGAAIGARPLAVLLTTSAGHVMLVLGVTLDAIGILWAARIVRRARPPS